MSEMTVTTQIKKKYLMGKTKDELCSLIGRMVDEIEALKADKEMPECECLRYKEAGHWHKEWCPRYEPRPTLREPDESHTAPGAGGSE